jgi:vancomycin permeability regulator SanA
VSNDEPETMRRYAIAHGVPEKDILTDDLGLRTYDSMVRAKRIFGLKQMVVVTQGFHVDRSLLYCRAVGIDALGVPADRPAELRDRIREPLACISALADIYLRHR